MAEYLGRNAKVRVDLNNVGGSGANWVSVGQQSSDGLTRSAETADATHKDSGGWAKALITRNSWSMTAEVVLDRASAAWAHLLTRYRAQAMVFVQLDASTIGGVKEEGQAIITNLSEEYPEADKVTGTVEFQGNGSLTVSP